MHDIPLTLLPTRRFSSALTAGQYRIDGIIGTNVLQQFLSTIDYPNNRLVLRSRGDRRYRGTCATRWLARRSRNCLLPYGKHT